LKKKATKKKLNQTKLIRLLSRLSPKEIKEFKAYIRQSNGAGHDVFLLLQYLVKFAPDFDTSKLEHELVFRKIFPKLPYNYWRLMKIISHLHLELKSFLVHNLFEEDDFLQDYLLAKVFTKYQLRHELTLLLNKKKSQKETVSSPQFYNEQMQWEWLDFFGDGKNKLKQDDTKLTKAMFALDLYYIGQKLKYACHIATKRTIFNENHPTSSLDKIDQYCKENIKSLPVFHVFYYLAWQLILHKQEATYRILKQKFQENYLQLEKEDQLIIFSYLLNFITFQQKNNQLQYLPEAFYLYKMGVEKDILLIDRLFVEIHFVNLISIACFMKAFDWIDYLLKEKLSNIQHIISPSAYHIALARLSIAKKNFLKCKEHLFEVDYNVGEYSIFARVYQLICAYELKEPPFIIETHCKSFENYLRRNKLQQKRTLNTNMHLKFISCLRKLIKPSPNKQKLQLEVDRVNVAFKPWLVEKIASL
jgi:hypothetical protein